MYKYHIAETGKRAGTLVRCTAVENCRLDESGENHYMFENPHHVSELNELKLKEEYAKDPHSNVVFSEKDTKRMNELVDMSNNNKKFSDKEMQAMRANKGHHLKIIQEKQKAEQERLIDAHSFFILEEIGNIINPSGFTMTKNETIIKRMNKALDSEDYDKALAIGLKAMRRHEKNLSKSPYSYAKRIRSRVLEMNEEIEKYMRTQYQVKKALENIDNEPKQRPVTSNEFDDAIHIDDRSTDLFSKIKKK